MAATFSDSAESRRWCASIVACWCLAIAVLPPSGLLWQMGAVNAVGHWLVNGVLATLDLAGLVS